MNEKQTAATLPRRALLASVGLAALAPALPASARPPVAAPLDNSPATTGTVRLTVESRGGAFAAVVAHFRMPGGGSVPFYAWNGGAPTSFTMLLTDQGLRFTVTEARDYPLVLTTLGEHFWTSGNSYLRIVVSPE